MRADVEAHARRLLEREATRSMSLRVLRDRLIEETGDGVPGLQQLMKDLGAAPGFLVLDAPMTLRETMLGVDWCDKHEVDKYEAVLRTKAVDVDARVMLMPDVQSRPTTGYAAALVARSVADLARFASDDSALRRVLNEALCAADEVERVIASSVIAAAPSTEDSSTTPPRDPLSEGRTRRRGRQRSSRPPRSEESR